MGWSNSLASTFTGPNSLDIFLWGHVKDSVYCTQVRILDELKHRISAAIANIPEEMLRRT